MYMYMLCEAWHRAGECKRRQVVKRTCPQTCGLCPGKSGRDPSPASRQERCRRDNKTAAFGVGALNPMFERVLRDYPQYSPVALSTSPYVVHLRDFVSADEATALRRLCKTNFKPSSDHSESVRTSHQCWCDFPACYTDPSVHNITRRIHELTGTHYGNGENLQVVRYHAGQYYRSHHDQNTAAWTPQGPRVLSTVWRGSNARPILGVLP